MRLMHTSLPEFKLKLQSAVIDQSPNKQIEIFGLSDLHYAKMQSLRTGRIEYYQVAYRLRKIRDSLNFHENNKNTI